MVRGEMKRVRGETKKVRENFKKGQGEIISGTVYISQASPSQTHKSIFV
jgi:hypothetical protein